MLVNEIYLGSGIGNQIWTSVVTRIIAEKLGYKKVKESVFMSMSKMMNEISYNDYKKDETMSSKQKVNKAIQEAEMEAECKIESAFIGITGDHINGINSFNKSHLIKHGVNKGHIESKKVNCITIKNLIEKNKITNLGLLFIDTEGYDGNIVYNFLETVNQRPIIIFEFIHIDSVFFEKVINKLDSKNYSYFEVNENLICLPKEEKSIL